MKSNAQIVDNWMDCLKATGHSIVSYSTGGKRSYRIVRLGESYWQTDGLVRARGLDQAVVMIRAFLAGFAAAQAVSQSPKSESAIAE